MENMHYTVCAGALINAFNCNFVLGKILDDRRRLRIPTRPQDWIPRQIRLECVCLGSSVIK